jgi:hypothetical protein
MSKYIDYDNCGVVVIRCMNCRKILARRVGVDVPSRGDHSRSVVAMSLSWDSSRRRRKIYINNNAQAELIVCSECDNDKLDLIKMKQTIIDGWVGELEHHGFGKDKIKEVKDRGAKMTLIHIPKAGAVDSPDNPDYIIQELEKKKKERQ